MNFASTFKAILHPHPGWYILLAALLLTWLGISAIDTVEPGYAARQLNFWLPVGLGVMIACMLPHPRWIGLATYPLMVLSIVLLIYLLIPGAPLVKRVNGASSWINLGAMSMQPAEFAKTCFVLATARYLRYRSNYRYLRGLLIPFLVMLIPVALILKQPDLGTALLFAPTLFVMLVAAGAKLRHLGALLGSGFGVVLLVAIITLYAPSSMQILKEHQQTRIRSMVSLMQGDQRFNQTSAYHQNKAMNLIGSGGWTGYGAEQSGILIHKNALPHHHNDTIFAVVVNRWGLLGGWAVQGLYLVLLIAMLLTAARNKDPFARLVSVGFATLIFTQAFMNIAMFMGLMPVTGITLPLVSYGGSSLLATFAMIGLMVNIASRRPGMLNRPSFEYDNADAIYQ